MLELTDQDLLSRLDNFEDNFVERKRSSDNKRQWLEATVAFANSVPVGYAGVLFIGVKNDGTIEETVNLDKLQQTFTNIVNEAYPPIPSFTKILERGGKQFLAILVPGSPNRPHFAGQSYIRDGSETKKASEVQFAELITQRTSKAGEILKWKNKTITMEVLNVEGFRTIGRVAYTRPRSVLDCNQFYVTLKHADNVDSIPLRRVEIAFDNKEGRLKLEVYPV